MKLVLFLAIFSTSLYAREVEVKMKSISFEPKNIVLATGDSVKWDNVALTEHSATGANFDTGLVPPKGQSKAVTFNTVGTFPYNCKIHGKTMSGTITVGAK